jgi:TRAP-type C4-dicarboxylate transport system permease small subunit
MPSDVVSGSTERAVRRVVRVLDAVAITCSGAGLIVILVATLAQVATRPAGGIQGVVDLTAQFVMPVVVLFAITVTEREGRHVRVVMLAERMSDTTQWWFRLVSRVVTIALVVMITISSAGAAVDAYARGVDTSGDIHIPLVIVLTIPVVAFAVLLARVAADVALTVVEAGQRRERAS